MTSAQPPHRIRAARTRSVRAARRVTHRPPASAISAAGMQPGDLAAHQAVEQPGQARRAREADAAATAPARAAARGADAVEAVVAEHQLQQRVVGRAADVRPRRGRPELDDGHEPARRDDHREAAEHELPEPPPDRGRRADQVDQGERRQDEERLQHLGQEREADERPREQDPARRGALEGPDHGVGRGHQEQDEQGVGLVVAEHQRRDRRQRQERAGAESGPGRPRCAGRWRTAGRPRRRPRAPAGRGCSSSRGRRSAPRAP